MSGALGGTRTPTILLTATSRQRVYQFRHERISAGLNLGWSRRRRGCNKSGMQRQDRSSALPHRARKHSFHLDADAVVVDGDDSAGDGQIIGQHTNFVLFGRVELDNGAAGKPHDLMNRHRRRAEHDRQVDFDFVDGRHVEPKPHGTMLHSFRSPHHGQG